MRFGDAADPSQMTQWYVSGQVGVWNWERWKSAEFDTLDRTCTATAWHRRSSRTGSCFCRPSSRCDAHVSKSRRSSVMGMTIRETAKSGRQGTFLRDSVASPCFMLFRRCSSLDWFESSPPDQNSQCFPEWNDAAARLARPLPVTRGDGGPKAADGTLFTRPRLLYIYHNRRVS
jgi:hypothetical protein